MKFCSTPICPARRPACQIVTKSRTSACPSERCDDAAVATHAQARQLILITRDCDFADIRNYPRKNYAGIIVLELPDDAIAAQVDQALQSFVGNRSFWRG